MQVVRGIYRYPLKGLGAQPVLIVALEVGKLFPFDRVRLSLSPGDNRKNFPIRTLAHPSRGPGSPSAKSGPEFSQPFRVVRRTLAHPSDAAV
jgi:hypothetical protein